MRSRLVRGGELLFRIRRIYDHILPVNREAIRAVQDILVGQFPAVGAAEAAALQDRLTNPAKHGYRVRNLGTNARSFLTGLWFGAFGRSAARPAPRPRSARTEPPVDAP